jgi:hypothetical protein
VTENFVVALKATVTDLESTPQEPLVARMKKLLELAEKQVALAKFTAK